MSALALSFQIRDRFSFFLATSAFFCCLDLIAGARAAGPPPRVTQNLFGKGVGLFFNDRVQALTPLRPMRHLVSVEFDLRAHPES